jgi:hypothetical protein
MSLFIKGKKYFLVILFINIFYGKSIFPNEIRLLLQSGASPSGDGSTSSPRARQLDGARPELVEGCEFQKRSIVKDVASDALRADLVIFSFDRPLQLYTYLESLEFYAKNLGAIFLLYRVSEKEYEDAYKIVFKRFPAIKLFKQDNAKTAESFNKLLFDILIKQSKTKYILFGVDDIIVTDYFDLADCIKALDFTKAYGFYLRTGKNITENYMSGANNLTVPTLENIAPGVFSWSFKDGPGRGVWKYANSVDMTLFNRDDVVAAFKKLSFKSPNTLESQWAKLIFDKQWIGLCYEYSKIVNVPMNIVQVDYNSHNLNLYSKEDLLKLFNAGFTIDFKLLHKMKNKSPHIVYDPAFIRRRQKTPCFSSW